MGRFLQSGRNCRWCCAKSVDLADPPHRCCAADAWPVHVGLARGYAATGDTKQALEHVRKALLQAPDDLNRKTLEAMIEALTKGASIN